MAMRNEFRYAVRSLWHDRGFTAIVVLSLAVGIGANTAIFSLVNGVLLRPPDYRAPEQLVAAGQMIPKFAKQYPVIPVNVSLLYSWRRKAVSFSGIAAMERTTFNLTGAGEPELLSGAVVSANIFEVLGVPPQLGRAFLESEDPAGHDDVVVLADSLWRRRFQADPAVIGRKILLNGLPRNVVGVLPASFRLPLGTAYNPTGAGEVEIYKPLGYQPDDLKETLNSFNQWTVARLRPGVSPRQAKAELDLIEAAFSRQFPDQLDLHAVVTPLAQELVGDSRKGLLLMMAAVGAVLMILWVNLANLSLVRAAGRARESAIRTALGAGRMQLARQSLLESMLMSLAGGTLGAALAWWGLKALVALAPIDLPRLDAVHVDARVLLFALGVSLAAGVILGILPAWRRAAAAPIETLKSASRSNTEGRRGLRVRHTLVSLEAGLSAALLVTAGLLIASFVRVMTVDKGFSVEHVIAVNISLPSTRYPEAAQRSPFFQTVIDKAAAMPGVQSASLVSALPLEGETWIDMIGTENDTRPLVEKPSANVRFISPGYFQTLRLPLVAGRGFEETDRKRAVAIISQSLARRLWPQQDAVGRKINMGDELLGVVGVTADARSTSLDHDPVNMLYVPFWQRTQRASSLLVRTGMDPSGAGAALRRVIWSVDPEVPVPEIKTLDQVMSQSVGQRRFQMMLVLFFAAAALALAAVGTYGVISYSVTQRTAEMGIRMALGAQTSAVAAMVLRQGMLPVVVGLAGGAAAALALGRYIGSLLFEVSPSYPLAYVTAIAVLLLVSISACLVPARRATRVNPLEALRFE